MHKKISLNCMLSHDEFIKTSIQKRREKKASPNDWWGVKSRYPSLFTSGAFLKKEKEIKKGTRQKKLKDISPTWDWRIKHFVSINLEQYQLLWNKTQPYKLRWNSRFLLSGHKLYQRIKFQMKKNERKIINSVNGLFWPFAKERK